MPVTRREQKPRSERDMALAESLPAAVDISRIAAGLTHEGLAERLGYSRAHITMLQAHKRRWTAEAILKVCRVTGDHTPIHWLCERAGGTFEYDELRAQIEAAQAEAAEATARAERLQRQRAA